MVSLKIIILCVVLLTCVYYFFITVKQNKEGKSPLHIAAMHGRFTGSQILIQNGNLAVKNSVVLFIPNPLQPKDAFLCLWTQVERSTVWICMNALLFMLLPNMVRSY